MFYRNTTTINKPKMAQLTDNLSAVEVPDDAIDFEVKHYKVDNAIEKREGKMLVWASLHATHNFWVLPPGTWQYLFTTKGCTEEDARKVVGSQYLIPLAQIQVLLDEKGCDVNKNFAIIQKL